jgi:hypothetical protein
MTEIKPIHSLIVFKEPYIEEGVFHLILRIKEELLPADRYSASSDIEKYGKIRTETTSALVPHIRSLFPHMTIISYDHHSDENEDAWIVDFSSLKQRFKIQRVEGFDSYRRRNLGTKRGYFVTNVGKSDLNELIKGLIDMQQPAFYIYLASENEINPELISSILESATDEVMLKQNVLDKVQILIELGPDADYYILSTKDKENYRRLDLFQ